MVDESSGRERLYRHDVSPLAPLLSWREQFGHEWPNRLDAVEVEVY